MNSEKEKKNRVFPKVYEKLLPIILILMAITVFGVMVFAAIVGLGVI